MIVIMIWVRSVRWCWLCLLVIWKRNRACSSWEYKYSVRCATKQCFETCKQKNNIWHLFLFIHFAFLFIKDFADDKYSFREHSWFEHARNHLKQSCKTNKSENGQGLWNICHGINCMESNSIGVVESIPKRPWTIPLVLRNRFHNAHGIDF